MQDEDVYINMYTSNQKKAYNKEMKDIKQMVCGDDSTYPKFSCGLKEVLVLDLNPKIAYENPKLFVVLQNHVLQKKAKIKEVQFKVQTGKVRKPSTESQNTLF